MKKIFSFNMISLDGFFEGPNHSLDWHNVDQEFNQFAIEQLEEVGTLFFGRVTYNGMASFWPTAFAIESSPVIAKKMNEMEKIVFSRTLRSADWNNSKLVNENVGEEVRKMKQAPGKDIAIFGSSDLTISLVELGLVDEFRFMVAPVVLGQGRTLFHGLGSGRLRLELLRTRPFRSGNVLLSYGLKSR
jgi:dihydrofolate reductase